MTLGLSDTERSEMNTANARDMREKRCMEDLSRQIAEFLDDPPARSTTYLRDSLGRAREALDEQCAQIVRSWD